MKKRINPAYKAHQLLFPKPDYSWLKLFLLLVLVPFLIIQLTNL